MATAPGQGQKVSTPPAAVRGGVRPLGTIAIIGLGYVGLPLALLAQRRGWNVNGIDIDTNKREEIGRRIVRDLDDPYAKLLAERGLPVAASFEAVRDADIVVVCVPTPVDEEHEPNLGPVREACRSIARHLQPGHTLIFESTVHPGTSEEVIIPLLEAGSGLTAGLDFTVAHCPERINPGDARWPVHRIPRVIGATTPAGLSRAADFYRSILDAPVYEMETIREAEAVKMVENCFRDVNIAFVNELAMSFSRLGIDISHVLAGAATKPFGFMAHYPGCGVGGHCIPVDPYYLIRYAKQNGFSHEFLSLARSINNGMPAFVVRLLDQELSRKRIRLADASVALLGLSYKTNISDLRESPALEIRKLLKERGADVRTFDPFTPEHSNTLSVREALNGADAALIATAHDVIKNLEPKVFLEQDVDIVIDGRNCLPKERFVAAGIRYRGVGR